MYYQYFTASVNEFQPQSFSLPQNLGFLKHVTQSFTLSSSFQPYPHTLITVYIFLTLLPNITRPLLTHALVFFSLFPFLGPDQHSQALTLPKSFNISNGQSLLKFYYYYKFPILFPLLPCVYTKEILTLLTA